jgi:hypothetical protein
MGLVYFEFGFCGLLAKWIDNAGMAGLSLPDTETNLVSEFL